LQYHNAWPAASENSVIQNYREIKTVRAAIGKTGVPRQLNTTIEEGLAVALQFTPPISTPGWPPIRPPIGSQRA
jgi:hypothetical protein